jgi:hypothetical protein
VVGVETGEEFWSRRRAQISDVFRSCDGVERFPVHQFKGPGPHSQDDITTSQLIPPADNRAETNVCEWAPNIRVNLDYRHGLDHMSAKPVTGGRVRFSIPARRSVADPAW